MRYHALLYSRSLSRDYRWMVVPPKAAPEGLKALNQLYNLYDKNKSVLGKSPLPPLYCMTRGEATFLVTCGQSNQTDKEGRAIYYLQGISVARAYWKDFWQALPWILDNYGKSDLLNAWGNIDFRTADDLARSVSDDYVYRHEQPNNPPKNAARPALNPEKSCASEPMQVSFDKNGLSELSSFITSSCPEGTDFAFGATPEMAGRFGFRAVALAGLRPTTGISPAEGIAASVAFPSAQDTVSSPGTAPGDSTDRFDPRKKVEAKGGKAPGMAVSFRILNQILPRFLSLINRGIKRSR